MANELQGKRVAFVATDMVEQVELTEPWEAVMDAGGEPVLVSPKDDRIQGVNHMERADTFPVDVPIDRANAGDFDALVLPGGVANPDRLRTDDRRGGERPFNLGEPFSDLAGHRRVQEVREALAGGPRPPAGEQVGVEQGGRARHRPEHRDGTAGWPCCRR